MIGEISFCDQVGFNIKTDETKKFILDMIQNKYGLKIITKHFDKYEDRMFENVQKRPHLLCVRSNGNPYFLCLIKLNFVNYCIFIDKKIQKGYSYPRMIISHFRFADELFKDTIFDGEMVKMNDGSWAYLMNDIIVLKGVHLREQNLVKRINYLYDVIASSFHPDNHDICRFGVKQYFKYDEAMSILEKHINEIQYSCRGIYFKPLFLKFKDILINFNDELVTKVERTKYKHLKSFVLKEDRDKLTHDIETTSICSDTSHKTLHNVSVNTECFNTRKTNLPDVYEIYNNDMLLIGYPAVPSLNISKTLRETFKNKNIVDTVLLQYGYCNKLNKWILVC
jgi:mRNA capping enzyme, catalytic domain